MKQTGFSEEHLNELKLYIRVASFLTNSSDPPTVRKQAEKLTPPRIHPLLLKCKKPEFDEWLKDPQLNRNAYHRLCLTFINLILFKNRFKIVSAAASQFDDSRLNRYCNIQSLPKPGGLSRDADFELRDNKGRNLIFCFYDKKHRQREKVLKRISGRVRKGDNYEFINSCFLIIPSHAEMNKCRQVDWADLWPRGFFICFDELAAKAGMTDKRIFGHLEPSYKKTDADSASGRKVEIFNAKVIENTPVGEVCDPKHFKIKFEANKLQSVVPGQFVMIDTQKKSRKQEISKLSALKSFSELRYRNSGKMLAPASYLKRPFSIHRAFYKYFEEKYMKNISLPHDFATVAHTVFPHRFEIFYKVLEEGIGTNELKKLKQGDTIQMTGPLGRPANPADLRSEGIKEVHLIGGGVGMAPLVFFGQALRYYSLKIKAFIGIDSFNTLLLSREPMELGLADEPENSYVYIDDLFNIGLRAGDIHISYEALIIPADISSRLPRKNCCQGFISDLYKSYLDKLNDRSKILVIACGPAPMIEALNTITAGFKIPMKVLLEKRMGCGIGVCMSCVCATKKNNRDLSSRVCMDGPLFDAEDIDWRQI